MRAQEYHAQRNGSRSARNTTLFLYFLSFNILCYLFGVEPVPEIYIFEFIAIKPQHKKIQFKKI